MVFNKMSASAKTIGNFKAEGVSFSFRRGVRGAKGAVYFASTLSLRELAVVPEKQGETEFYVLKARIQGAGDTAVWEEIDRFVIEEDAKSALAEALRAIHRSGGRKLSIFKLAIGAVVVFVAGAFYGVLDAREYQRQNGAAAAPGPAASAPAPVAEAPVPEGVVKVRQPEEAQANWADMQGLKELAQFKVGEGETQFYVFSDPRCPACQGFETMLKDSDATYSVVPVASQGEQSAVLIAQVMCAEDRPSAWRTVLGGEQVINESLSREKVETCVSSTLANLRYFLDGEPGGNTATPTIIAPDGAVHVGAFGDMASLKAWVSKRGAP